MDDFLSKKDLQETLKSKWADLLIHGDVTILSHAFVLSKYLCSIDCYFRYIGWISCLIAARLPKISSFLDYPSADCKSQVSDPKAFGAGICLFLIYWKMSRS